MLRHLRQIQADEDRVRRELLHLRRVEQVARPDPPLAVDAVLDVVLPTRDLRAPEILALLAGGAGHGAGGGEGSGGSARHRHVGHRILDAVVVPAAAIRQPLERRQADAQLAAHQAFGAELVVGEREDGADAELAIELVERRGAEARPDAAERRHAVGHAVEHGRAGADGRVARIGQRAIVGGRHSGGRGLEVAAVGVLPVVDASAERHRQIRLQPHLPLHKAARDELGAARLAQQGHGESLSRVEPLLVAGAVHVTEVAAGREQEPGRERLRPLRHATDAGRRHFLPQRHAANGTRGVRRGNRKEVAVERLEVCEDARLQIAVVGECGAHAASHVLPRGVVAFLGAVDRRVLAVVAFLVEVAAANKRVELPGRAVVGAQIEVAVVDVGLVVDQAAFVRNHDRESVGREGAAVERGGELAPHVAHGEISFRTPEVAVLCADLRRPAARPRALYVDHATHCVVAVQARPGAFHQLDAIDVLERHARPVHPATERVVERDAIDEHQRAADAARPDAAQRHALGGRVRRQAAGAAKETERRRLAQHVVGDNRGRPSDLLLVDDADVGRHVGQPLLGTGRRYRHRLEERRRRQLHFERSAVGRLGLLGEPAGADDDGRSGRYRTEREPPVGAGHRLLFGPIGTAGDHGRAGHDAAARIGDDAGDPGLRRRREYGREQEHHEEGATHARK